MRKTILATLSIIAFLSLAISGARACSPTVDYANRTMQQKIEGAPLTFIGKVEEVGEDFVVFRIGTPGTGAAAKGETMRLAHQDYGTCGKLQFKVGDVWLYGGDTTFSASQKIDDADFESDIAAVVARLDKQPE